MKKLNKKYLNHTLIIVVIILLAVISLQAGYGAVTQNINNTSTGGINDALTIISSENTIELDE